MLILRAALAATVLIQAAANPSWFGAATAVSGLLLTFGFLTPLAAILPGMAVILPEPVSSTALLAGAIVAGVVLLGPGAFSMDARLFGRRRIIIPPIRGTEK